MRLRLALTLVLSFGCSSKTTGGDDCGGTGPCSAGSVCLDGVCRDICRVASDCDDPCSADNPDGESCVNDVCVLGAGCNNLGPVITSIDGTGLLNGDANPETAEHFIGSGLRISGSGLANASVRLHDGGTSSVLTVDSSTDTELVACLPTTAAGVYSVTVANQAGTSCGDFELIQGAQGPVGPAGTYTGEEVVNLVNAGLTANSSLSIVGTLTESDGDGRYVNTTGDTMNGELDVDAPVAIGVSSASSDLVVRGLLATSLTGVVTITAASQEVLGAGTSFVSELRVGDALLIEGETYEVASIADGTHLTLTSVASTSAAGVTATRDRALFRVETGAGTDVLQVNRSGTVIVERILDIDLQRVTGTSCSSISCVSEAICPAGQKVLSGGCSFSSCSQHGYDYNYPKSDLSGWYCRSNQCANNTAYALCGNVQ